MSANKETSQFYCDFDEIESTVSNAEGVYSKDNQVQSDDEKLRSDNSKIKKNNKFRKMVEDMVRCLPQEKEKVFGQPKTHKQELREENKDWKKRWEITEKELAQLKSEYDAEVLKSQILQTQIDDLERERAELLNRLSKIAGGRLTHENVQITDLSDEKRPVKLSDTYCELYDNEWTDAFQELTDHGLAEKVAVGTLLDILLVCFHKCREITWERYQTLKHIVSTIDIVHMPKREETLCEVVSKDNCNNTSKELKISYSLNKEIEPPTESEEVCNPDISTNASNESEIQSNVDNEFVQTSQFEETDVKGDDLNFLKSNVADLDEQNGLKRTVEYTTLVSHSHNGTNNSSKELEILYSGKRDAQNSKQPKEEHFTTTVTLHFEQDKQIKDIWRETTTALKNEAVKHLYLVLVTRFDLQIKDLEKTSKYLNSCIDLCWNMGVQEKPMHLESVAEKDIDSEKIFNQDKFKAFTKSGQRVDFVVWPALFLYEGGPMLFKGIAQGCEKSDM